MGSPPPMRAAIVISRMTRVNTRPRLASVAAFLCLIVAHFECPDMTDPFQRPRQAAPLWHRTRSSLLKFGALRLLSRCLGARTLRCGDLR